MLGTYSSSVYAGPYTKLIMDNIGPELTEGSHPHTRTLQETWRWMPFWDMSLVIIQWRTDYALEIQK